VKKFQYPVEELLKLLKVKIRSSIPCYITQWNKKCVAKPSVTRPFLCWWRAPRG